MKDSMMMLVAVAMLIAGTAIAEGISGEETNEAPAAEAIEASETPGEHVMTVDGVIFNAKLYESAPEREEYLLEKTEDFLEQGRAAEAEKIAQYILAYINGDSKQAQELLTRTRQEQARAEADIIQSARQAVSVE